MEHHSVSPDSTSDYIPTQHIVVTGSEFQMTPDCSPSALRASAGSNVFALRALLFERELELERTLDSMRRFTALTPDTKGVTS